MAKTPKPKPRLPAPLRRLASQVRDLRDEVEAIYDRQSGLADKLLSDSNQLRVEMQDGLAEVDGRAPRLASLIEDAHRAVDVLNRVELGLRPMLLQALKIERTSSAHWMEDSLDDAIRLYRTRRPA